MTHYNCGVMEVILTVETVRQINSTPIYHIVRHINGIKFAASEQLVNLDTRIMFICQQLETCAEVQ